MRVGLLGVGGMGTMHAAHWRALGVEVAFYDPDPAAVARFGGTPAPSENELIRSVDIVDVCTPTDVHAKLTLEAIVARKPTFVEKPIARTLAEAMLVVQSSESTGVPVMVGQVVRFFAPYRVARDQVLAGSVGKPAAARMKRGGGAPGGWFLDHARSGGVLLDLAIHDFDWLRWTFGPVTKVYSKSLGAGSGPDYALSTLTFESGLVAHVESTWMDPSGFRVALEVCGSEGMFEYDSRAAASVKVHTSSSTSYEENLLASDDPYRLELQSFLEAVKSGAPVPVPASEGLESLRIALGALESAATGRVVEFTPSPVN
jgi:myo-inositol 2-dehydrogenase/D-chiro-inositol 1-dehydrogenase